MNLNAFKFIKNTIGGGKERRKYFSKRGFRTLF